jgi:7-cyano-7-deazaguanine synthase
MSSSRKPAVVLLSGGLDSAVALALAKRRRPRVYALTIDYGQIHSKEVRAAQRLAGAFRVPHKVLRITLPWKGSALLSRKIPLPHGRTLEKKKAGIPPTYVPARNTLFLSYALSWAETLGAGDVYIGAHTRDFSGYPDCRPKFLKAMERVFALGTRCGVLGRKVRIQAPLLRMTKAEIIRLGRKLRVPLDKTWSCYEGGRRPCGTCASCLIRAKGFKEAGS